MRTQTCCGTARGRADHEAKAVCFLERVAATIYGVKPAEILFIAERDYHRVCECFFRKTAGVYIHSVKHSGNKRQVMVYHKDRLDRILQSVETRTFLESFGYRRSGTTEDYVGQLLERLQEDAFPHEIGVFLGYPLKDVCGYLGLNDLEHTMTKGWKMYGDTRESERLHERFTMARVYARKRFDCFFNDEFSSQKMVAV